ncbi:MAG: hypothetical protein ACLU6Z_04075 [Odoribacter splanchnicus]
MKKVIQGGTIINEGQQFQADLVIEGERLPKSWLRLRKHCFRLR